MPHDLRLRSRAPTSPPRTYGSFKFPNFPPMARRGPGMGGVSLFELSSGRFFSTTRNKLSDVSPFWSSYCLSTVWLVALAHCVVGKLKLSASLGHSRATFDAPFVVSTEELHEYLSQRRRSQGGFSVWNDPHGKGCGKSRLVKELSKAVVIPHAEDQLAGLSTTEMRVLYVSCRDGATEGYPKATPMLYDFLRGDLSLEKMRDVLCLIIVEYAMAHWDAECVDWVRLFDDAFHDRLVVEAVRSFGEMLKVSTTRRQCMRSRPVKQAFTGTIHRPHSACWSLQSTKPENGSKDQMKGRITIHSNC